MARIIALDFGKVRTGVAVTDELQLIASALDTLDTHKVIPFLKAYVATENVERVIVGEPKQMNGQPSEAEKLIQPFLVELQKALPHLTIERHDERFTSKMAFDVLLASGAKKKRRRNKAELDKISATLILQSYLEKN